MKIEDIGTTFYEIYCSFIEKVTDDLLMEMTMEDTYRALESMLISSIPRFNFPRFRPYLYDRTIPTVVETIEDENGNEVEVLVSRGAWEDILSPEEIEIYADLMLIEWLSRQLQVTKNTQMKYSGPEFKMSSQASHLQRLSTIIKDRKRENMNMQFMYNRRVVDKETGRIVTNYHSLAGGDKIIKESINSQLRALSGGCGND